VLIGLASLSRASQASKPALPPKALQISLPQE
jgi:hypothetical protein